MNRSRVVRLVAMLCAACIAMVAVLQHRSEARLAVHTDRLYQLQDELRTSIKAAPAPAPPTYICNNSTYKCEEQTPGKEGDETEPQCKQHCTQSRHLLLVYASTFYGSFKTGPDRVLRCPSHWSYDESSDSVSDLLVTLSTNLS
eukprot:COSAG05_NODE_9345_length_630_cov_1.024482_1_plen_143_part_01